MIAPLRDRLLPGLAAAGLLAGTVACGDRAPAEPPPPGAPGGGERIEATSLLGVPLPAPALAPDFVAEQERLLAEALAELEARPDDPDALIWVGRRTAYLGRYRDAIEVYTRGIEAHPDHAPLYRHRGHRYLTTRRLDRAVADLERAAELIAGVPDEIEPDGLPNERNVPTSTSHSNIWYHLGLARYLRGDLPQALAAYRECLEFSNNPDMLVATSHWLYMTLRRLGREDEARAVLEPIHAALDVIENRDYLELLLLYRGEREPDALLEDAARSRGALGFATIGYGVGNWHLYHGRRARAVEIFRRVLDGGTWAAFGFLAAEADLARLQSGELSPDQSPTSGAQ